MAERKSKIRFSRADLKEETAGQAENTAVRRRPRPPSEVKGKSAGLRFDKADAASEAASLKETSVNSGDEMIPEGMVDTVSHAETGVGDAPSGITRTKAGQKKAGDTAKAQTQQRFGSKLRTEQSASKAQSAKLRFESSDVE